MTAAITLAGITYTPSDITGETIAGTLYTPAPTARGEVVTIGDSFTDPESYGSSGWPVLVAGRVGRELVNLGVVGSGYARVFRSSSFPMSVAQVPITAEAVIVWGGYNDQVSPEYDPKDIAAASTSTFTMIRRVAPRARLVVIGPQWNTYAPPSATILAYRDAIKVAALEASADAWLDPIAEQWFIGHPELVGPDALHPSLAGQAYIADRIAPLVADALAR